jgi:hypothetical protein
MKKEIRNFILLLLVKLFLFSILLNLYGEYIISRNISGFLQIMSTFLMIAIFIVLLESIGKSIIKLKNKEK